ncbi:MAG: response regulator [Balneolales bacterium]
MGKPHILIVEDNLIIALDLQEKVQKMGYAVARAVETGEEAIRAALVLDPDLILMDISLKGKMNGIEAVAEIREVRSIPVIYLTGNSEQLKQGGLNELYIDKPIHDEELRILIESTLFHLS